MRVCGKHAGGAPYHRLWCQPGGELLSSAVSAQHQGQAAAPRCWVAANRLRKLCHAFACVQRQTVSKVTRCRLGLLLRLDLARIPILPVGGRYPRHLSLGTTTLHKVRCGADFDQPPECKTRSCSIRKRMNDTRVFDGRLEGGNHTYPSRTGPIGSVSTTPPLPAPAPASRSCADQ